MNATRISRSRVSCRRRRRRLRTKRVRTGAEAFGDWRTDSPGVRRLITPADLPAPFATKSAAYQIAARRANWRRHSKSAAGLLGRSFRQRAQQSARHSRRAERRHLRGGNRSGPRARFSPGRTWRRAGAGRDLRRRRAAASTGSRSIRQARTRASSMSRRRIPSCAFPIAAER